MGKGKAVAVGIFGVLIFLIGLALIVGMLAANTLVIIAGPFLILAVILMAIGVYLMNKAKGRWDRAATTPKQVEKEMKQGCNHPKILGDKYGRTCLICGKQLSIEEAKGKITD
jgi:uncharacterized membrane protein